MTKLTFLPHDSRILAAIICSGAEYPARFEKSRGACEEVGTGSPPENMPCRVLNDTV